MAGDLWLCLSVDPGARSAPSPEYSHVALSVDDAGLAAAREHLARLEVRQWKENRSEGDSLYILDPDGHKLELHTGDLASRITACRAAPYEGMVFFD